MAPHAGRVAATLTSSKHCSARVVFLRLRFQVGIVGIETVIENCGLFPATAADTTAVEPDLWKKWFPVPLSQELLLLLRKCGPCLSRLGPECWVGFRGKASLEEVQVKFGDTRIACLVKVEADKSTVVRLIVDMLRSGVNGVVTMMERIVLPTVADLASGAVDLLEVWPGTGLSHGASLTSLRGMGKGVEFAAADFADAFLTALEHERKYVVVKGSATGTFSATSRSGSLRVHFCGARWQRRSQEMAAAWTLA